jgi:hypothetical protein
MEPMEQEEAKYKELELPSLSPQVLEELQRLQAKLGEAFVVAILPSITKCCYNCVSLENNAYENYDECEKVECVTYHGDSGEVMKSYACSLFQPKEDAEPVITIKSCITTRAAE